MTLYRKYRPQKFSDLAGQNHIRDTLIEAVKEDKLAQAYLFSGPRGTGKTTTARLIAKVANCLDIDKRRQKGQEIDGEPCGKCSSCMEITEGRALDIIEIDAASNRGIDEIRELREQVKYAPAMSKFKVYIIDEVHMLTREAFNALLKTLEEPPKHAIFILATTEPHKVLPTIISRTQRFDFKRITLEALINNMRKVAKAEGIDAENEALEMIATLAAGGGRDSLSLLEQVVAYSNEVSAANVRSVLGLAEIGQVINLLRAIFNSDAEEGLKIAHSLFESGSNFGQLNASIVDVLRKLLTLAVAGSFLANDTAENKAQISTLFIEIESVYKQGSQTKILAVTKSFIDAGKLMKETVDPLVSIELAIVESCDTIQTNNQKPITKKEDSENKRDISIIKVGTENVSEKSKLDEPKQAVNLKAKPVESNDLEDSPEPKKGKIQDEETKKEPEASKQQVTLSDLTVEAWNSVIGEVKKENTTLAALLKDAKPMTVENGKLMLGVRFKFHKDKISEAKNVQVLEGIICNVTGNSCRVVCEIADFSKKVAKESHSDDELVSEAEKVFGE